MSELRDFDDRLSLDQLGALGSVQLPTVDDRSFEDIEVIRIAVPSLDAVEAVRG